VGEICLSVSERQIHPVVDDQVVSNILQADRLFSSWVVEVLSFAGIPLSVLKLAGIVGVAQQFSPCVSTLQSACMSEAAREANLKCVLC
jgi:hypothetical protein